MFVHSGASLHGHEYSPADPHARRSPLVRSAFSAPSPRVAPYDSARIPTRPARKVSPGQSRTRDSHVSFFALDEGNMSDDEQSISPSDTSETTAGGSKRRRRTIRSSSTYHIANPAPTLTRQQKLVHIRPKLLLQFQKVLPDSRPIPTIDVLPSFVFVPRLAMKFPHMFRGKGELGLNDVMVVRSEDYSVTNESNEKGSTEDEYMSGREILAVICQIRGLPGSTEICFSDGTKWYGSLLPRGFELVNLDPTTGEKTVARWIQRTKSRRNSLGDPMNFSAEPRFGFSIINPSVRRHPILATLTQSTLNIPEFYTTVSSSAGRYPPTSPIRTSVASSGSMDGSNDSEPVERATVPIDENLRTLIQITAVWVALKQGWCHYFKYDDNWLVSKTGSPSSPTNGTRRRSNSFTKSREKDGGRNLPESPQNIRGKLQRNSTQIYRNCPMSISHTESVEKPQPPKRAISTGSAFMERAAAAKRLSTQKSPSHENEDSTGSENGGSVDGNVYDDLHQSPAKSSEVQTDNSPETPTKHRRVKPADNSASQAEQRQQQSNVKAKRLTNSHLETSTTGYDTLSAGSSTPNGRSKNGRWKSLISFMRRCVSR